MRILGLYTIASPDSLNIVNVFRSLFAVGTIKGIGHLWFVSAILFCYFVTPYLAAFRDYISQKIVGKQLILLLALFCIVSIVGVFTNGFTPGNICCYMLGYFMAVYVKRYGEKVIKISFILSLLPCIVSNAIYIFLKYVNGIDMQGVFSHVTLYSHMFLAFSIVTLLIITFGNIKKRRIYEWSDNYSYEVYIVHQLFILSPFTMLTLTTDVTLNIIIATITIFISGYILGIVNKRVSHLLNWKRSWQASACDA